MILSKRSIVIGGLVLLPLVFYLALGTYAMWSTGLFWWSWIFLPVCWLLSWATARLWKSEDVTQSIQPRTGTHWTQRDEAAATIVRQYQEGVREKSPEQLTDPHFYLETIKSLATDLATHYHPESKDPYSALKVTEVLAAVRLAVDDLEGLAIRSIPGSRLLTIGQWRSLQHAPQWVKRIQDSVWLGSILLNPANIVRYYTSKATIDPITNEIQTEVLAVLYLRFIRQVGFYLIEMNSGRLRAGADAYRKTFGGERSPGEAASQSAAPRPLNFQSVSVALVGQVSSGKSSLVNALLGQQAAASDVLPTTRKVQRYQCPLPESDAQVELLDTPGYGEAGATASQLKEIQSALEQADVLMLVIDAHSPARKPDQETMKKIDRYYEVHPELKRPRTMAVLTHIDLLSPVMVWDPPYDWRNDPGKKEVSIREAVDYCEQVFGSSVATVVPACLSEKADRRWGVREEVLPAFSQLLPEAQSAAMLRAYEKDLDRDRWWELVDQIRESGLVLAKYWRESRRRPGPG